MLPPPVLHAAVAIAARRIIGGDWRSVIVTRSKKRARESTASLATGGGVGQSPARLDFRRSPRIGIGSGGCVSIVERTRRASVIQGTRPTVIGAVGAVVPTPVSAPIVVFVLI